MKRTICKSLLLLIIPGILFSRDITATSMAKLSPDLQALVAEKSPENAHLTDVRFSRAQTVVGPLREVLYPVTIRSTDIEAVKAAGINTNAHYPGWSTARVSYEQLLELSELDAVSSIFQGDLLYPLNDLAVGHSGADLVQDGYLNSTAYDGTDVIFLIIDTGIDWTHLDFRDPVDATKSRILYIWDQTDETTYTDAMTPYDRNATFTTTLNYGAEYTNAQINSELDGSAPDSVKQTDTNGHGTEVASGAVGNGASLSSGSYKGMAPDADIVVVKAGTGTSFLDVDVKNALTYAQKIASTESKPVVVNLSLGNQSHAHDGTATLDEAVDSFTASGNGRVAVVAAGNAGNEPIHVTGTVANSATGTITITVPSFSANGGAANDVVQFELWWDGAPNITAKISCPDETYSLEKAFNSSGAIDTPHGAMQLINAGDADHSNGDLTTQVQLWDNTSTQTPEAGDWTLDLTNSSGSSQTYHAWLNYSSMGATVSGGNTSYTVASPGVASSAITVGAYSARWKWYSSADAAGYGFTGTDSSDNIAYFSSIGPTREGSQKPDICVPGRGLFSATSTDYSPSTAKVIVADKYHITEGTSGASGIVSGAVALLLDYNTSMTAAQAKSFITGNADSDSYTGGVPNYTWGYGKLNIFESLADAIGGSVTLYHKSYANDAWGTSAGHLIDNTVKEAVKFTATAAGEVTGAFFFTHTTIPGSGSVSFEIWTDASGLPSTKVGSTVTMNCADMGKYTWNYVSLKNVGVNVLASENFHLVMRNTSGSIFSLRKSTGSISNKSSTDLGVGWAAQSDKDWRMRVVVSNNVEVTTSGLIDTPLPVELSFFNASTHKGQMVLKWATESETENQGFRLDRRAGRNAEWELIADHTTHSELEGQGSSSSRKDYSFIDESVKAGILYDYRLSDIPYSAVYKANTVILEDVQLLIDEFTLYANYPNPFNPSTQIAYQIATPSQVSIRITDIRGREIRSWDMSSQETGYYETLWDGLDADGKSVAAGVYFSVVQAGSELRNQKMLLLK
ncbi:S8 family serine peptidase [bacterium]|nr:S8 family serine peptidase [bacterium]